MSIVSGKRKLIENTSVSNESLNDPVVKHKRTNNQFCTSEVKTLTEQDYKKLKQYLKEKKKLLKVKYIIFFFTLEIYNLYYKCTKSIFDKYNIGGQKFYEKGADHQ